MRDSKKAFISTGIVLLLFSLLSGSFLMITSPNIHNYDWKLREQLSGSLDFLIVGASHGQCAFYTREIDRTIGCNSYNLCFDAEQMYERHYLLDKELSRNNIETVILDISYDTLQSSGKTTFTNANIFTIMRMDSFSDRMRYFFKNVMLDNKLFVYSEMMYSGMFGLSDSQNNIDANQWDLKGSRFIPGQDHSLPQDEVVEAYNQDRFTVSSLNERTVDGFTELVNLGKSYGARVIVAVAPVSDNFLWRNDNLDEFYKWATDYCSDTDVEFYDFNLLKNRYELFSDIDCYSTDEHHMSEKGSRIFSKVFADIIQKVSNGQDVSGYFYSSFEQMKKDSPYMAIMESMQSA